MLEYNTCLKDTSGKRRRIDIPEGIYVNKISASKECDICHYWYFKDIILVLSMNHIFAMIVMI